MHKTTTSLHLLPTPRKHGALYLHYTLLLGPDGQPVRLDYWPVVILIPLNHTRNLTIVMERHTTFNEKLSLDSNVPGGKNKPDMSIYLLPTGDIPFTIKKY